VGWLLFLEGVVCGVGEPGRLEGKERLGREGSLGHGVLFLPVCMSACLLDQAVMFVLRAARGKAAAASGMFLVAAPLLGRRRFQELLLH
jgi:hypothetical protein